MCSSPSRGGDPDMSFILEDAAPQVVPLTNLRVLLSRLQGLRATIEAQGQEQFRAWEPRIWQRSLILEQLAKTGIPSRAEITDAAMSERAECVMLNKGAFITDAVKVLDDVLTRMQAHQRKKTPQLRALQSW